MPLGEATFSARILKGNMMLRLAIIDQDGKAVTPQDVATAAELLAIGEQARSLIRECERLVKDRAPQTGAGAAKHVPYV